MVGGFTDLTLPLLSGSLVDSTDHEPRELDESRRDRGALDTPAIDRILQAQPVRARDDSLALYHRGEILTRLPDIGEQRVTATDAAGFEKQILSVAPPGAHELPRAEAAAFSREAHHCANDAVGPCSTPIRVVMTSPMSDPGAALADLGRTADARGHLRTMSYGRRGALYRGFDPATGLALVTFAWGPEHRNGTGGALAHPTGHYRPSPGASDRPRSRGRDVVVVPRSARRRHPRLSGNAVDHSMGQQVDHANAEGHYFLRGAVAGAGDLAAPQAQES